MEDSGSNRININEGISRELPVLASEIIKKFKTKQDRQSFCKENSI